MIQIIKYASIIVFVAVFAFFVGESSMIEAGKNNKRPQYEIIDFDFKIYTIRGHEYLTKEGVGMVHMADCE
jgi:hypothetical protein